MMLSRLPPFLQEPTVDLLRQHWLYACQLASLTIGLTVLLELRSLDVSRAVLKQDAGLYKSAICLNLRNHYLYGTAIYTVAATWFVQEDNNTALQRVLRGMALVTIHSLCFYSVHRWFHSNKRMYKYHAYHHQFFEHVPPISANAVSTVEYVLAYILPFAIGIVVAQPDSLALRTSVMIVATCNLLIHTPCLEQLSMQFIPPCFVSTNDHLEHHRKANTKYAAPTINVDYFVEHVEAYWSKKKAL